ncbi:hypothetical protein ABZ079_33790 [Streptomyces sp. NPDC006314]|uniref:hypothetical protein n=1 Tax=Streptomyces sp. NPDC006314 TaxID=3154475 RepID=UPI0033A247E6
MTSKTSGSARTVGLTVSRAERGDGRTRPGLGHRRRHRGQGRNHRDTGTQVRAVAVTAGSTRRGSTLSLTVDGPGGTAVSGNGDFETWSLASWTCENAYLGVSGGATGGVWASSSSGRS